MLANIIFDIPFITKLVVTAVIVVTASMVTERFGALIGALVVTLPVTVWPAFLFLSLDHDTAFLAASAVASLAINSITAVFMLVFILLARRWGLIASLIPALATWFVLALAVRRFDWNFATALSLSILLYGASIVISWRFRQAKLPPFRPKWYDVPLRTSLVCMLMGTVLVVSAWAGPVVTGIVAAFPISTTCTMLILHPRIGGRGAAAVIANGLWGMAGISLGLAALHLTVEPHGKVLALALALALPVTWNLLVWLSGRRAEARFKAAARPGE